MAWYNTNSQQWFNVKLAVKMQTKTQWVFVAFSSFFISIFGICLHKIFIANGAAAAVAVGRSNSIELELDERKVYEGCSLRILISLFIRISHAQQQQCSWLDAPLFNNNNSSGSNPGCLCNSQSLAFVHDNAAGCGENALGILIIMRTTSSIALYARVQEKSSSSAGCATRSSHGWQWNRLYVYIYIL